MSILGLAANSIFFDSSVLGIIAVLAVSFVLAAALKVYLPGKAVGRDRLESQPAWPLLPALGLGFMVWLCVQVFYGMWKTTQTGPRTSSADFLSKLTAQDFAFLATVPPLAGFAALLTLDLVVGGIELLRQIGFTFRHLAHGVARGLIAALVILPPTYVFSIGVDTLYNKIHYIHPTEHQLLKAMSDSENPGTRWILILAAAVVAPLFEEFLFRGHIQTLIKRGLIAIAALVNKAEVNHPSNPPVFSTQTVNPSATPIAALPIPVLAYQSLRTEHSRIWPTWATIILTSCLFALVHEMWMWPPIFLLSIGLGYCYERTGNLWTNITVHCLFNSVSTFFYLYLPHS